LNIFSVYWGGVARGNLHAKLGPFGLGILQATNLQESETICQICLFQKGLGSHFRLEGGEGIKGPKNPEWRRKKKKITMRGASRSLE
jgi:hypothetical protein